MSIITTTRNRKLFLEKLIKNILDQNYKNIEHIVVDAASTDGTQELLKSYGGKYDLKWISEKDRMQTEGVNKGLKMATGELITITHDDDAWLKDGLKTLVNECEKDNDLAMVYGDSCSLFSDGRKESTRYRYYSLDDMVNGGYQIPQHTCVFRRDWLRKVGLLDENIEHVAEYELFLRIIKAGGKYKYIPKFVAIGYQHENKASWKCWDHSWDETWLVNRKHGGLIFSKFALVYIKYRYFRNLGEWLRRLFPKLYELAKKIFKVPIYG